MSENRPQYPAQQDRRKRRKKQVDSAKAVEPLSGEYSSKLAMIEMLATDRRLSATESRVLTHLVLHLSKKTGEAWPSQRVLAELTGCKERTVRLAITKAEQLGFLTAISGTHRGVSSRYTFDRAVLRNFAYWHPVLRGQKPEAGSRFDDERRNRDSFFPCEKKAEKIVKKAESRFQEGGTTIPTSRVSHEGNRESFPTKRERNESLGVSVGADDEFDPFDLGDPQSDKLAKAA